MRLAALLLAVLFAPAALAQTDTAPTDSSTTVAPPPTDGRSAAAIEFQRRQRLNDAETKALVLNLIVPGLGHLNAGDTGTGAALLALGVGLPIGTALATGVSSFECSSRNGCDELGSGETLFLAAAAVGLTAWIYGMVDADNAVHRVEARRLSAAPTAVAGADGLRPGLALRLDL